MMQSTPAYDVLNEDLFALIPETSHRFVDIGCMLGTMAKAVRARRPGCEYIGIDIDEGYVDDGTGGDEGYVDEGYDDTSTDEGYVDDGSTYDEPTEETYEEPVYEEPVYDDQGGGGKDADRTGEPELSFLDVQGVHGSAGFAARLASRSRCKCRGVEDVDGFPVRAFRKLD